MGMFDYIVCKYPLPRPNEVMELKDFDFNSDQLDFKTKSLESALLHYEIRADGTIWVRQDKLEYVKGDSDIAGYINVINSEWIFLKDFTGSINFYDYLINNQFDYDYYIEYDSVFIDGKISKILLSKFEALTNKDRKEREKEFREEMARKRELKNKWYFKHVYLHYRNLVKKTFSVWRKFSRFIPTSWQVQGWIDPLD